MNISQDKFASCISEDMQRKRSVVSRHFNPAIDKANELSVLVYCTCIDLTSLKKKK